MALILFTWRPWASLHFDGGHLALSSSSDRRLGDTLQLRGEWPPMPGCEAASPPRVALLTLVVGYHKNDLHDAYWVAVANRRAYAIEHSFPLYLMPEELGTGQHAAWEKFIALRAVFQHSCATWVWMSDADAYIMNLQHSIEHVIADPLRRRNPREACNTTSPDVIVAGACLARMNTGSVLWRNNEWTRQHVADAWHAKHIARPAKWWDQAAVLHLYKSPEVKPHYCIVTQRTINVYPNMTRCHDGSGTFQDGDLLVHFPGGMKKAIGSLTSRWLRAVPIMPSRLEDVTRRAHLFIVGPYSDDDAAKHEGRKVHVTLTSPSQANLSSMPTRFDLFIEPQMAEFANWGWPVANPAAVEAHLGLHLRARGIGLAHLLDHYRHGRSHRSLSRGLGGAGGGGGGGSSLHAGGSGSGSGHSGAAAMPPRW